MTTAAAPPPSRSSTPAATPLLQVKTVENDGYSAVQVGFDTQKESRVTKPVLGHFKKAGSEPKKLHPRVPPRGQRDASPPIST